jgi:spermidine synthase
MASLAAGYYWGGKLADKRADKKWLALILVGSGFLLLITLFVQSFFLNFLSSIAWSLKIKAVLASLILLAPAGFTLGIVSPYAAKLKLDALSDAGSEVGRLYALSTLGSLVGTFSAGFWLVPFFGTTKILIILTALLWFAGGWLFFDKALRKNQWKFLIFCLLFLAGAWVVFAREPNNLIDKDTSYSRVWVYDSVDKEKNEPARVMRIDSNFSSAMFLNSNELAFDYTKFYRLGGYFNPGLNKALMIGGAGYSYPKDFLLKFPRAEMTVVEIDPAVTALAKQYFNLPDDPRLIIQHADGRVWLNQTKDKYDAIFVDAFSSSFSIPFHLATKETAVKEYNALNDDGVVMVNIAGAITGDNGKFTRSLYQTYRQVFPQVYLFPVNSPQDVSVVQNVMLVALKSNAKPNFLANNQETRDQLKHLWQQQVADAPILTDDWAPTDYFASQSL